VHPRSFSSTAVLAVSSFFPARHFFFFPYSILQPLHPLPS
jgi:hypothetical protein